MLPRVTTKEQTDGRQYQPPVSSFRLRMIEDMMLRKRLAQLQTACIRAVEDFMRLLRQSLDIVNGQSPWISAEVAVILV